MSRAELAELSKRIEEIKKERERFYQKRKAKIQQQLEGVLHTIELAKAEIQRRTDNPEAYPIGAGAGTIANIEALIEALKKEDVKLAATNVEEEENDYDQAIDDLELQHGQVLFTMATEIGIEKLRDTRRELGKKMREFNRLQKEHYDIQKERYEDCKKTFGFTEVDRVFIAYHKGMNEFYKTEWTKFQERREEICDLIEELDPEDPDLGWDEHDEEE